MVGGSLPRWLVLSKGVRAQGAGKKLFDANGDILVKANYVQNRFFLPLFCLVYSICSSCRFHLRLHLELHRRQAHAAFQL